MTQATRHPRSPNPSLPFPKLCRAHATSLRHPSLEKPSRCHALALPIYGVGLPAFVLQKALQPLFYAREDTRSPFRYAVWSMVLNAALSFGLMPLIGFSAAAWATTLSAWVMVGQLWWCARSMGEEARFDARFLSRFWRIVFASAFMGAALWGGWNLLQPMLDAKAYRILALCLLIAIGMASYALAAVALKAVRLSDLKRIESPPQVTITLVEPPVPAGEPEAPPEAQPGPPAATPAAEEPPEATAPPDAPVLDPRQAPISSSNYT